ncbi:MAG: hypothetical protein JSW45_11630 [Thiotrichales bacterium]|nr:MAG: hypothetical protein JSW45_11630 [Thiotrichales bacterium]
METPIFKDDFGDWDGYSINYSKSDMPSGLCPGLCRQLAAVMLLATAAFLMSGCDDSGINPVPSVTQSSSPSLQEFTIGPEGGTIEYRSTVENVTVTLDIPPAAVSTDTVISIDHAQNFPDASGLVNGAVFEFGPDGMVFDIPVNLTITYGAGMLGSLPEEELRIHRMLDSSWIPLLGVVDAGNKVVDATLTGFNVYGLKTIPRLFAEGDGGDDNGGADTWGTIQADILRPWCVPCHNNTPGAAVGLSFEADQYDTLVTDGRMVGASMAAIFPILLVDPGNSTGSFMIWKLNGLSPNNEPVGIRMPASGPPFLEQPEIERIAAWIDAGAPDGGGGSPPPGSSIVPTWYGVQANVMGQFCTLCHTGDDPPEGLSWEQDQYDIVVTNQRTSAKVPSMALVQPGDPDASYMYWKITGNPGIEGVRMPAFGGPLDQELIDVVRQWILDGAPLGDPADADSGGGGGGGPTVSSFPEGSWMHVWSESLRVCTQCHRLTPANPRCGVDFDCPAEGVVLTADNYLGVVDDRIVQPSSLQDSELWERVNEGDPARRMPLGLEPLTQQQLDIIRDWILDGAPFCPSGEVCP